MEPIIVAIALICGKEDCANVVQEPRFESLLTCEAFLHEERYRRLQLDQRVVLDDCITTTEDRIREFR